MLTVERLTVRYGPVTAVRDASFTCAPGQVTTILGTNGAGKTTTLTAIAGAVTTGVTGSVTLDGHDLLGTTPEHRVRQGIALVPERRRIFGSLTVRENLQVATTARSDKQQARRDLDRVMQRFPVLAERGSSPAGLLSGGQQQQLAIARALLTEPRVLLLDEPSLGLAPLVVDEVFTLIDELRQEGLGIVLVEQNVHRAIAVADTTLLLTHGQLTIHDTTGQTDLDSYFGWDPNTRQETS